MKIRIRTRFVMDSNDPLFLAINHINEEHGSEDLDTKGRKLLHGFHTCINRPKLSELKKLLFVNDF